MEHADEGGEVGRADSPSVSPGADEHAKSIKADQEVYEAQETSDKRELRAFSLAIDVACLDSFEPISSEITVEIDIIPVVIVCDTDCRVGCLPCGNLLVLRGIRFVSLSNVGTLKASRGIEPNGIHAVKFHPVLPFTACNALISHARVSC